MAALEPTERSERLSGRSQGWHGGKAPTVPPVSPFEAVPARLVCSVARALPDRWRVETRADEEPQTAILVTMGRRWWTGIRSAGPDGVDRIRPERTALPAAPGVLEAMLDASRILDQLTLEPLGEVTQAGRACVRLVGTHRDVEDYPVWPGDAYELRLDREFGVLLRFAARYGGAEAAVAEFGEVRFNVELPEAIFLTGLATDAEWREA